jgi:purine-nucleoside phosphorylase
MKSSILDKAMDYNQNYEKKVREAADYIKKRLGDKKPAFAVVLGSGLAGLADSVKKPIIISYNDIPSFPRTTVPGHDGKLIIGAIEGVPVIVMKGRKHYYEVADEPLNNGILKVVFPVHVMAELGVKNYFATSAVGGLNQVYKVGDLLVVKSHISFVPNPLLGRQHDFKCVNSCEPLLRFQPMHDAYDEALRKMLLKAGLGYKKYVHQGVLLTVTGPTYETHAEGVFFRKSIGADAVGMSLSPEVIVARNRGMKVVAFSCITDMIGEDGANPTCHEEVMSVLNSPAVKQRFKSILEKFFRLYKESNQ